MNQKKLMEFCKDRKIVITAYSPLGSPDRPWAKPEDPQLLEDAKLKEVASKLKRSPAQVVLRYQVGFQYLRHTAVFKFHWIYSCRGATSPSPSRSQSPASSKTLEFLTLSSQRKTWSTWTLLIATDASVQFYRKHQLSQLIGVVLNFIFYFSAKDHAHYPFNIEF